MFSNQGSDKIQTLKTVEARTSRNHDTKLRTGQNMEPEDSAVHEGHRSTEEGKASKQMHGLRIKEIYSQ